jgi:hypothetical protein
LRRVAFLAAIAGLCACIDKPPRPSERADSGPGDDPDGGTGTCGLEPDGEVVLWSETDEIRFNQRVGLINGDCRDDVVIPGSRAAGLAPGVFIVLGREAGFMDGFDDFIDTDERQPIDLALSDLVGGDDILDLMVVATGGADTFVIVYRGEGDGTFTKHAEKVVESVQLQAGDPDAPQPTYLLVAQLEPDVAPSLLIGDSLNAFILSPGDWDDPTAIRDTPVLIPATFNLDNQTQDFGLVGADDREVDDLFDMAAVGARWYANDDGEDAFVRSPEYDPGIEGPGPAVFLDMDGDGDEDVTSVRLEGGPQLETLVLEPSIVEGEFGTVAAIARFEPGLEAGGVGYTDFDVRQVVGDDRPDAVLINPDFDDGVSTGTKLYIVPNLAIDDTDILSDGDEITFLSEGTSTEHEPNRLLIGQFRDGVTEIRGLSDAPALERGFCHRITEDGSGIEPCSN